MKSGQELGAAIIPRLLVGIINRVCRFPKFFLACALFLCGFSLYASATFLQYHTQRGDLINPHKDYQERWQKYLAEFGDEDDMVVVVQGNDRDRMKQALDSLAAEVQKQPQHFDRLFYKVDLRHLRNRALLFLPKEQISQIQNNLRSMK